MDVDLVIELKLISSSAVNKGVKVRPVSPRCRMATPKKSRESTAPHNTTRIIVSYILFLSNSSMSNHLLNSIVQLFKVNP